MKTKQMVLSASFAALMALSAWLCVPVMGMTFTLQTFGLFLALLLQGGKWGTVSVLIYLLLGAVGMPVFSGFQGGIGVLFGATGGYIWGFLAAALVYRLTEKLKPLYSCALGLAACYIVGTVWFAAVYGNEMGIGSILLTCVVPYLLPDGVKLLLALLITRRIGKYKL